MPGKADLRDLTEAIRALSAGAEHYRRTVAAALGLNTTAVLAMGQLHRHGPLTPRALATDLALTTGSITALVDRLCAAGYAARTAHPNDRRSLFVGLTAKGKRAILDGYDAADARLEKAVRAMSERGVFEGLDLARLALVVAELGMVLSAADVDPS